MKNKTQLWQLLALLLCLCMTAAIFTACMAVGAEEAPSADASEAETAEAVSEEAGESVPEDVAVQEETTDLSDESEQEPDTREVVTIMSEYGDCREYLRNGVAPSYYGGEIHDLVLSEAIANHEGEDVLYRVVLNIGYFSGTPENPSAVEERLQYAESLGIDVKCYVQGPYVQYYFADLSVEDMEALGEFGGFTFDFERGSYLNEDAVILDYTEDAELLDSLVFLDFGDKEICRLWTDAQSAASREVSAYVESLHGTMSQGEIEEAFQAAKQAYEAYICSSEFLEDSGILAYLEAKKNAAS